MKEIINHFFYYEYIYIFLFSSIIFLFLSVFVKKNIIKKIALPLFSIFFVLFCFEFGLSFSMEKIELSIGNDNLINLSDKQLNQRHEIKIKSKIDGTTKFINTESYDIKLYEKVYDAFYSAYHNCFRYVKCDISSVDTYVFLGCSFTFGDGLNDNETLPYYFSKLYNFEKNIINCAVSGKSTNTVFSVLNNEMFLPLIKNEKSKIKHFFYFVMRDHIARNFRITNPSDIEIYKNQKWYIPTIIGKIKYIFARSYIFRKVLVPVIDECFKQYYEDYMIKSLKEINRIVEEKYNSKLAVIIWEKEWYREYFIKKLKETKLDLIFLPEYFVFEEEGYRIKNDGHPTAKANKEVAEILYNHIK